MSENESSATLNPGNGKHILRFGVMCNGPVFQRWQADALRELQVKGHHPAVLIVDNRPVQKRSFFGRLLRKKWGTSLFSILENRIFRPDAKNKVDLHDELQNAGVLNCKVDRKGFSEYFNEADLSAIRGYRLDFILRFGFNIIRGDILTAAKFGVWSFHHGDEMFYRGGPAGFWEIFRGDPVSGAILQRLTGRLDGGIILEKGYLKTTMHSYRENISQLLTVSSAWPAAVAGRIAWDQLAPLDAKNFQSIAPSVTKAPVFKVPGNLQMLKFLLILVRNRLRFYYREMVTAEIWNVGIIRRRIADVVFGVEPAIPTDIVWLKEPSRLGYLADPAGYTAGNKLHIFAEEYSYAAQKAGISEIVCTIEPGGKVLPGDFVHPCRLEEGNVHMSYPYVFENNGSVYCLPESYQSNRITLYRRDDPGDTLMKERVLLDEVAAVDPTLFFYRDIWWLFFTGRKYSNTHLFIYYAKDLAGDFLPHRNNPVKTDIRSSRPAGTPFVFQGNLYRPAQDCSVTYGGRVVVNLVVKLSPDEFEEQTVKFIEPIKGSKYELGLHTLSSAGEFTLVDGKRYRISPGYFLSQIRNKMTRKGAGNV